MELRNMRRIWKRQWRYQSLERPFTVSLPFEIRLAVWPEIEIVNVAKEAFSRETNHYEVELVADVGCAWQVTCSILGERVVWDAISNMLTVGEEEVFLEHRDGVVKIHIYLDAERFELCFSSGVLKGRRTRTGENMGERDISVAVKSKMAGSFEGRENGFLISLTVYGLRMTKYSAETEKEIEALMLLENESDSGVVKGGQVVYQSENYCIRERRLSDKAYGEPDAYVPNPYTIFSLPRVTEEFEWRHTPMGDMTRILNHGDVWRGKSVTRFPEITTQIPSVDAAYHVAVDVLSDACSLKFALPGENGMWSAGAFQGEGMGFGVWRRDTMQIFLRGGVLWEPEVSKKTLQYIMADGKDNAADGIAAPVISCWDYYLATHDMETVCDMWPQIQAQMREADARFDCARGLLRAEYGSANDAFADTKDGGYALSTEIYFMEAYRAAAKFAGLFGLAEEASRHEERWRTLLQNIRAQYWNEEFGYYTSGPVGSEAFASGNWESCGQEAAILERFGVADDTQKKAILKTLEEQILTEYGIPLMPGRRERSHVTHAAWPVYYTGYAQCAAASGNHELLMKLIAQQIRNAVFEKTFYEVLDTDTGMNWRWPGQTWHAMGYISMLLYGVFGLKMTERGISFEPCVPRELEGIRMENLRYCKMELSIETRGAGKGKRMLLDGSFSEKIPWNLEGKHTVVLNCE